MGKAIWKPVYSYRFPLYCGNRLLSMGFRIFCFFPNFNPVNLCRMTVPGEFLSAVIGERTSSLFSFASTAVSMTREILFGVSLPILLPIFFGLDGLLWSFPAADLLTFLIALFFIRQTYLELKK